MSDFLRPQVNVGGNGYWLSAKLLFIFFFWDRKQTRAGLAYG